MFNEQLKIIKRYQESKSATSYSYSNKSNIILFNIFKNKLTYIVNYIYKIEEDDKKTNFKHFLEDIIQQNIPKGIFDNANKTGYESSRSDAIDDCIDGTHDEYWREAFVDYICKEYSNRREDMLNFLPILDALIEVGNKLHFNIVIK